MVSTYNLNKMFITNKVFITYNLKSKVKYLDCIWTGQDVGMTGSAAHVGDEPVGKKLDN